MPSGYHSSIGNIAPADKLNGCEQALFTIRDARLEAARERRGKNRMNEAVMNSDSAQASAQAMGLS